MTTKLTLTIERNVIHLAKTYAHRKRRSLSELIENYLMALVAKESPGNEHSQAVKRLLGSVKAPKGFDYKKVLEGEINRRHSR